MSLVREVMNESQVLVNEILGHACVLTNTSTGVTTPLNVVIQTEVEWYQGGQFAGIVATGVFDRATLDPKIGNSLLDQETGINYVLEAVKTETPAKIEFVLGER